METELEAAPVLGADYSSGRKFADFPISRDVLKGVLDMGYTTATPVQAAAIEPALAGRDMLVRAKTGTGKTTAFGLPIVEKADPSNPLPGAIVLAPTRELAQQIAEEIGAIGAAKGVTVAVLVGGVKMGPQEQALEGGVQIVVGTPGRVLDHLRRGTFKSSNLHIAVLDEADEMLSMGFYEDVTAILDRCASPLQVLLFSATISPDTERLAAQYLKDPEEIQLSTDTDHVEGIEHILYETSPSFHKVRSLLYLLDLEDPTSAIIFCNTREDAATVASFLDRQGLDAQLLSGELPQGRRNEVMRKVKAGEVRFLVATDVASRGIDISDLSHVINYAMPPDPSVYMHRVGRTGRIGKKGTAISLVGGPDLATRRTLENVHQIAFTTKVLPDAEACVAQRVTRQAEQIRAAMSTMVFEAYLPTVRALKELPDGEALLAAALRSFFQWDRHRRAVMAGDIEVTDFTRGGRDEDRGDREDRKGGKDRDRKDRDRKDRDGDRREARDGDRKDRKDRDGDRKDRKDRDKDRGKDRKDRGDGRKRAADAEDLDALLSVEGDSAEADDLLLVSEPSAAAAPVETGSEDDADKKKKKRRRKKKKGGREGAEASGEGNDDGDDDATDEAAEDSRSEAPAKSAAPAPAALDDLDSLLSLD
jgi:ATP-dependent RNA helicase DeaD